MRCQSFWVASAKFAMHSCRFNIQGTYSLYKVPLRKTPWDEINCLSISCLPWRQFNWRKTSDKQTQLGPNAWCTFWRHLTSWELNGSSQVHNFNPKPKIFSHWRLKAHKVYATWTPIFSPCNLVGNPAKLMIFYFYGSPFFLNTVA